MFSFFKGGALKMFGKKKAAMESENSADRLINENSSTRILEAYRMARTNLFYSGDNADGGAVFGVTSASPGDGKSLTCANLAISIAMSGKRVLLIDCDMRKPTQKTAFGAQTESGLSEYLAGVTDVPCVCETQQENLWLLTSGRCPPNPAELLYRPRFAELIANARETYDYVFVDLPPVGLISDAAIVAPQIQFYVLVIRMKKSDMRLVQASAESLEKVGGKIAGLLLNDVADGYSKGYKGGGYSKYGRYGGYSRYYRRYYSKYYGSKRDEFGELLDSSQKAAGAEEKPEAAAQANTEATIQTNTEAGTENK